MDGASKKFLFTKNNYLLDLSHLKGLESSVQDGDSSRFMRELFESYLSEAPRSLNEIHKALLKSDRKSIAELSYRLRISSKNVGATYIAELGLLMEKALINHPKDLSEARALGDQLKDAYLVTRDQIQAYLALVNARQP